MKKTLKISLLFIFILSITFSVISSTSIMAFAEDSETFESETLSLNETAEPQGIASNITLTIGGDGNGHVWARARNNFTLFPAKVQVYVELYSSETYQESYQTMHLEVINYIADLDMGKTFQVIASTGGASKYWQARIRSKMDNHAWKSVLTDVMHYDANANMI